MRQGLITGHNVDAVDLNIGLQELNRCGYDDPHTVMVITYALQRWAKGEEDKALKMAIDPEFHGINLISWTRVIAAATGIKN